MAVAGRELVERVAFAQVDEDEQGFRPGSQLPPARTDRLQVPTDAPAAKLRVRTTTAARHDNVIKCP